MIVIYPAHKPQMKKLTISDFKGDHFDPIQIVESLISFDNKNPKKSLLDILEALNDCDSIVEAVFYKKEKNKRGIDSQKDAVLQELCKELKKEIKTIHLNEIGNSFHILEQKKAINELARIQKIIKYSIQMQDNAEQILSSLFNGENLEELKFLAEIIYAHTTFSKSKNYDVFIAYSKKLETKIGNCFKTALESQDIETSKMCFDILQTLDKEFTLIDEFLLAKDLFTSKMIVHPPALQKIELNHKEQKSDTFKIFLDQTEKIIGDNFGFICLVFGKDEYIDYILSKIYRTLISISLGDFLNVSNPPIFLKCLQSAFESIDCFGKSIKLLFQKFDYSSCTDDIFSRFIFTATLKEKQLFDEILDLFISGNKTLNSYSISGDDVAKSTDFIYIFNKMLTVIDGFITRSEMIYTKENQKDVLDRFSSKLCSLIEKMTVSYKLKLDLINDLIYMHLTNCKYFGDKGETMAKFNDKLVETISFEFDDQIQLSIQFLKGEISNLFFTQPNCHKKLEIYLKKLFASSGLMGEKNFKIFTYRIADVLCKLLYKQVQFVEVDEERLEKINLCIDDLFLSLPINCSSNFVTKFNHLKLFTSAIILDEDKFLDLISKNENSFNELEMKYLVKCRTKKASKKNLSPLLSKKK